MKARIRKLLILIVLAAFAAVLTAGAAYAEGEAFLGVKLPPLSSENTGSECSASGSVAADALRYAADADFAVLPSGMLAGGLEQGFLTREQLEAVVDGDAAAAVAGVTPARLKAVLENSVSHIVTDMETETIDRSASDWEGFAQVSGLVFKYDASAPAGERVVWIKLPDGTALDLSDDTTVYRLASTEAVLSGSLGYPVFADAQTLDIGLVDALESYIADCGTEIRTEDLERITAIGAGENQLIGILPVPVLIAAAVVLIALFAALRLKPVWDEYHFEGEMK